MPEIKISIAAGTNVGLVRDNNEDDFVVSPDLSTSEWLTPQADNCVSLGALGSLLVVADGMGGANAGEVASGIAIETVKEYFVTEQLQKITTDDKRIQDFMKAVVKKADSKILQASKADSERQGMGTTIVMAWILGERAYVCWCGDSRCYAFNKNIGLVQLSKDHSLVQELVDRGELAPENANDHPLSNVVTRCLGDVENRSVPETRIYQLHDEDFVLLCSDGLCGVCYDDQIISVLAAYSDEVQKCKDELISLALAGGGYDNVTVALCRIQMEGAKTGNSSEVSEDDVATTVRTKPNSHRFRFGLNLFGKKKQADDSFK